MGSRTSKEGIFHQVGYHGRRGGRVEREEFERVKSASSKPGLNYLIRDPTWAIRGCSVVPQFLDAIQFDFVSGTCEETSDVKEFFIPYCAGGSGLAHEGRESADLLRCGH